MSTKVIETPTTEIKTTRTQVALLIASATFIGIFGTMLYSFLSNGYTAKISDLLIVGTIIVALRMTMTSIKNKSKTV